jgi:hypothetical protein
MSDELAVKIMDGWYECSQELILDVDVMGRLVD